VRRATSPVESLHLGDDLVVIAAGDDHARDPRERRALKGEMVGLQGVELKRIPVSPAFASFRMAVSTPFSDINLP
jgi:hypothetical protein